MVFEAVVVDLLNRFLNEYVENLDTSQLKIGIWGGNVVLNDLKIKSTVFDELNIPVRVKWGKLGRLSLKIPWKNLYYAPAVVEVEELLVVIIPFMEFNYDPGKEEKWIQERKQAKLAAIEEAKKRELEESSDKKNSFLEKLLTQIIKNLQVVIKNIHIRYEDKITIPNSPFSVGVTLSKLSCESTANDTTINYSKFMEGGNFICKKVDLKGLSIYWNSNSELFSDFSPDKLRNILIETIPTNGNEPKNLMFLFGPLSASAFLRLNPKPENDGSNFTIPKIFVNVHLKTIELGITSSQFCDALSYAEEFERFLAASKYRKFRPKGIQVHGHSKEWWRFAYTAVLDDIIRRRREWSWGHIREHRGICKEYSKLFKLKLTSKKMLPEDGQRLHELEKKLNVFNLVLIREQVYVQVERIDKEKKSSGWFSSWFGAGSDSKDESHEEEFVRKIQRVMTTDEKEKLYKAIGYEEETGSPASYPLRFVEFQFWFHLDEMKAVIYDNKTEHRLKKIEPILSVSLKSIKMELEQRPALAVKFVLIIGRFHVIGKEEKDGSYPELVTSTCQESESLIEVLYEMKPLNSPYDMRLIVNAQPLKIIFHAETVNVVRDIFNPPRSEEIDKIVAATSASLPTFRRITAVGLQYAIEKRTEMELQVNMLSSHLIVPYEGVYRPEKEMLVLILGSLHVETEKSTSKKVDVRKMFLEGTTDEEIFSTVLSASYTNFKFHLTGVQVLFQLSGEDWVTASQLRKSPLQFLEQTNLELTIKKSLVMDDARIPKIIIEAQVPSLPLNFSEERFLGFVVLASSISMKTKRPSPPVSKKGLYGSSWSILNSQLENTLIMVEKNLNPMKAVGTDYVQGIDFVGNFEINEMIVNVTKTRHIKHESTQEDELKCILERKFLNLQVTNLGVEFTNKTFENISLLKLGGIRCNQFHNKQWLELVAPLGEGNEYLFLGQYIHLDTKIPDFYTAKNAIVNRLTLTMTPLNVVLDNARMLAMLEFVTNVQRKVERLTEKFNLDRMADAGKDIETIHEEENIQTDKKVITKGKRFRKKSPQKEVIDFFLQANLDGLSVVLHFENRGIAKFSLEGGSVVISIRKSYLTLDVKVHDISLQDLYPLTKHAKIVKALEDETLSSRITIYDKEYFGTEDTIDMSIEAEVGGIQCTFVRVFFVRIIAFLSGFQSQIETLKQGASIAAQKAKENVVKAFQNAAKICLNLKITAPLLLIPRSSVSLETLEIDLGVLTVRNSITELDYIPEEGVGRPVIDLIKFHLDNLKMGRRVLSEDGLGKTRVRTFLVPVTFNLSVKRNLSRMWFRVIPEVEILARLATIRLTLTNEDLSATLNILKENITEEDEQIKYQHSSAPKFKVKAQTKSTKGFFEHHQELMLESKVLSKHDAKNENFYTVVKFIFFLDSFIFDTKTTTPGSEKEVGLGRFVLQSMSAKGRLFSNGSIYTAMQLEHCFVDDTRPGDGSRLTRFMGPADNSDLVDSIDKETGGLHMVEVIYQTQGEDAFFEIRVYRFRLIISMDYLKRLLEFFSVKSARPPEEVKAISKLESRIGGVPEGLMGESTFTVNVRLEKPDIIFVENLNSFNVDALVFHTELVMKFRFAGERKILSATFSDIELDTCSFNPSEGLQTLNQVIKPFTISVAGSTPEGSGLHIDFCVTDIFICIDPSTVNLISNCFQALMTDSSITEKNKTEKDYSDLWDVKPFSKDEYTFLQAEVGVDAVSRLSIRVSPDTSETYNEICLLALPSLIILVEGEQTRHMEPLILLEMGFAMRCYNWSENLSILNSLQLQMKYFNKRVFDWEPLIEPVEKVSEQNLRHSYVPWELNCSVTYSGEGEFEELRPPQVQVTLSSKEVLPITFTKTSVDLLKYAVEKYTSAVRKRSVKRVADLPPFVIKNETGESLQLLLDESKMQLYSGPVKGYKFVKLNSNSEVELQCIPGYLTENKEHLLSERRKAPLFVKFPEVADSVFEVSIEKPFKRYHPFTTSSNEVWVFVTDVSVVRNSTLIVFRSICTVKNYFDEPINVHILSENNDEAKYVGTVEGHSVYTLPFKVVHDKNKKLFFSVNGYTLSVEPFAWIGTNNEVNNSCLLQCTSKVPENSDPFFIQAYTEKKMAYYGNTNCKTSKSGIFKIHLQPTVKICNSLMFPLVLCFQGSAKEEELKPGNSSQISSAEPGTTSITLRIDDYLDKQWSCRETILENPSEFLIWQFASYSGLTDETINLGVHVTKYGKASVYTIYCPYLMINKTGYLLSYKFEGSSTVFFHPGELVLPIMLSPGRRRFFSKKMANLKVERSGWSDGFSLDVAGSGGTVECISPDTNKVYKISVTISLSQNSRSRMIVLTPFYVLINSTNYNIEYQECNSINKSWLKIPSHDCVPFWPRSQGSGNTIRIRPEKSQAVTPEFTYQSTDVFLLRLPNEYGGINVRIKATNSGTYITFSSYEPGQAPVLLLNHCSVNLTIKEVDTEFSVVLKPAEQVMHAWLRPTGKRTLAVQDDQNQLTEIEVNEDANAALFSEGTALRCVCFLDGSQRMVLFTEDSNLSESISSLRFSTSGLEIISKIHGIGISLVNDISRIEIIYIAFFSSGVSWESKQPGKRRFKVMKKEDSVLIEKAYQRFIEMPESELDSPVSAAGKFRVNFEKMEMVEPFVKELKRTFEPGLWLAYRQIEDYVMLHVKVHKVQVDSQLLDCIFPVVLGAVPPSKTVAALFQDPKPFFELSVVRVGTDRSGVLQYKYFKSLMQEFHVKLDIGLMHQLYRFIMPLETPEEQEKINFKKDLNFVEQKLIEFVEVVSTEDQKNFFDLLHFSPLKIHFSFSMGGKMDESKQYIPPSMSVLLQSVGATLTDIHDVVFRLSYLERKACFLTNRELKNELMSHYTGQIVRQAYVLLLGLDVIGNPFGLIVGIGEGVEAFFYEPFQGMIRGPSEFGKGVAIGWKKMFGHTVGSAAGTLGKLTDSLGKGLAVLSLDEEYQMKRMTERSSPASVQTQMARGGRDLVMGVVEGVAGVVQKPIKGACKEGLGGFVKGVGKGMMGLITRPVTGVVDFATTSFYAVNRTTLTGAKNDRLRPPRYIREYDILKPYYLREAQGYLIFYELAKQKYFTTDNYEYHLSLRNKEIVVLTDKRIILAEFSDVFGTWQEHTTITWDFMPQEPQLHPKGIALSIPKYNKAETKVLVVEDPFVRDEAFTKMVTLYRNEIENPDKL